MIETSSNRFPLLFALVGALALLGLGGYLFWRNGPIDNNVVEQSAERASSEATAAATAAGMDASDRKATEAIVRAYILENPEIITEAAEILHKREAAQRLTAVGDDLATVFPGAEFGNPKGDVMLVEFTDYNCGYCRSSVADVQKLVASDNGVHVIYRELPILSATSREAAAWALAAAKQGKHKAFHDAMFSGARPDANSIHAAAAKAGMDMSAAEQFAKSSAANIEIEKNLAMMQQVGFNGTPTFIIGDQILEGAIGYDGLKAAVAKTRKEG